MYILFLFVILSFWFTAISLAPFVPTFSKDLDRINKLSDLKEGDLFVEIWCWSAKVSRYIALNNPNSNVIWIELNFVLFLYSKIKSIIFWPKNLTIKFWNAFKYNYSSVKVAYIFWVPDSVSGKIKDKLYNELPKWWKYISYVFDVEKWDWNKVFDKLNEIDNTIYICTK